MRQAVNLHRPFFHPPNFLIFPLELLIHFAFETGLSRISFTMAPVKRKGNAAEEAAARQPQKRVRVGAEGKTDQKKQKTKASTEKPKSSSGTDPKPTELTVLRDEEAAFPRGGASILTPLERKQIQLEATKDVLFEQKGPKKSGDGLGDEEGDDVEMNDAGDTTAAVKKPRKKKTKGKKVEGHEDSGRQGPRIEGLSFKVWQKSCLMFNWQANWSSVLSRGL